MRLASLAFALALALALAGCVPPPELGPPLPAELRFDACEHQLSFVNVPMEEAQALMPPGFAPDALDPAERVAQLFSLATRCERVDNETETMSELLFGLLVTPPENDTLEGASFHFLFTGLRTTSPRALATYAAWNVTRATKADVTIALDEPTAPAAAGQATTGGADVRTTMLGQPTRESAGTLRGFVAEDGVVVATIDYAYTIYMQRWGAAVVSDPNRVSGFALDRAAGQGVQEWGEGYGLVLRRAPTM